MAEHPNAQKLRAFYDALAKRDAEEALKALSPEVTDTSEATSKTVLRRKAPGGFDSFRLR